MYCSVDDIIADISYETLAEISNDSIKTIVDEDIVNAKITEISNYIDTYLSGMYSVPYTNEVGITVLNRIATSLVVCDLYQRRLGLDYPESLEVRRRLAISELEKIQRGVIKLPVEVTTNTRHYKVSLRTAMFLGDNLSEY